MKYEATQEGFTLLEVVITIFILVAMLVFFTASFSTTQLSRIQQHKDIALRVMEQKMETLRAAGYSGVGSSGTFSDALLNSLNSASASTTISDYNGSVKQVMVGVSWVDASTTFYLSETTLIVNSGGL